MARYLAEAICELAAPPLQPSFIRVVARQGGMPSLTLLLHMRPRQLSAGAEVAVYRGIAEDEEAETVSIQRRGKVFAVRQTQAGLEQFVADVIATSPEQWDEIAGRECRLELPLTYSTSGSDWESVRIDLLPASKVQPCAAFGHALRRVRVSLPSLFAFDDLDAAAEVTNDALTYGQRQSSLREEQQRQAAASGEGAASPSGGASRGAAPAAQEQPDSPNAFDSKWRALRDEAMAQLRAALLATLRQALRFRGSIEFPAADQGEQAAGAPGQPGQPGA